MGIPLILALPLLSGSLLMGLRTHHLLGVFVCLLSVSVSKPSVLCPGTQPSRDFSEGRVAQ